MYIYRSIVYMYYIDSTHVYVCIYRNIVYMYYIDSTHVHVYTNVHVCVVCICIDLKYLHVHVYTRDYYYVFTGMINIKYILCSNSCSYNYITLSTRFD